ncbi:MAG: DUF998 domain-containing protein [Thaumarchaeota archaeon]|jgi:hypothetical membrane protein|nr:DUF998 domain-containing protein [Candidatus Terraquivivens yellowstonensis]
MSNLKVLGIIGLLSLVIAYSSIALSISVSPWFSWIENALSDLGARHPSSPIFNLGLMLSSVLALIFAIGLKRLHGGVLGTISVTLYVLSTISLFMIGFFPETAGIIHYYVSVAFFVFVALTLIAFGICSLISRPRSIAIGIAMLLLAVLAIVVWLFPWKGVAIPELISSLAISTWVVISSIRMLSARGQQR